MGVDGVVGAGRAVAARVGRAVVGGVVGRAAAVGLGCAVAVGRATWASAGSSRPLAVGVARGADVGVGGADVGVGGAGRSGPARATTTKVPATISSPLTIQGRAAGAEPRARLRGTLAEYRRTAHAGQS